MATLVSPSDGGQAFPRSPKQVSIVSDSPADEGVPSLLNESGNSPLHMVAHPMDLILLKNIANALATALENFATIQKLGLSHEEQNKGLVSILDDLDRLPVRDMFKLLGMTHDPKLFSVEPSQPHTPDGATSGRSTADMHRTPSFGDFARGASHRDLMGSGIFGRSKRQSVFITSNLEKNRREDDGLKTINNYTILDELGRGSYGKVKLAAVGDSNEMRAIKIVQKTRLKHKFGTRSDSEIVASENGSNLDENLAREIAILKKIRHKNIVKLHEVIDDPESEKLYMVMQYIERGPIVKLKGDGSCDPLDLDVARSYMKQLSNAVAYLHVHRICHRDIKPDNILLGSNGLAYLTDFGVSSILDAKKTPKKKASIDLPEHLAEHLEEEDNAQEEMETRGTVAFLAPEAFANPSFDVSLTPESFHQNRLNAPALDVWALGVTFYVMLFGRLPFDQSKGYNELVDSICSAEISFAVDDGNPMSMDFTESLENASFIGMNMSIAGGMSIAGLKFDSEGRQQVEAAIDLLKHMLDRNAHTRYNIHQVRKHAFIQNRKLSQSSPSTLGLTPPLPHHRGSVDVSVGEVPAVHFGLGEEDSAQMVDEIARIPTPPPSSPGSSHSRNPREHSTSTSPSARTKEVKILDDPAASGSQRSHQSLPPLQEDDLTLSMMSAEDGTLSPLNQLKPSNGKVYPTDEARGQSPSEPPVVQGPLTPRRLQSWNPRSSPGKSAIRAPGGLHVEDTPSMSLSKENSTPPSRPVDPPTGHERSHQVPNISPYALSGSSLPHAKRASPKLGRREVSSGTSTGSAPGLSQTQSMRQPLTATKQFQTRDVKISDEEVNNALSSVSLLKKYDFGRTNTRASVNVWMADPDRPSPALSSNSSRPGSRPGSAPRNLPKLNSGVSSPTGKDKPGET